MSTSNSRMRLCIIVASGLIAACGGTDDPTGASTVTASSGVQTKAVASRGVDADGNGRADVYQINAAGTLLRWSMSGAQIAAQNQFDVGPGWRVIDTSGDYNGDGRSDILWRDVDGTVAVWLMNGGTLLGSAVLGAVPADWTIHDGRGDYDGDGRSDILWRNGAGTVAIWRMNGTTIAGTFFPATVPAEWSIVSGGGDYDGDGRSDVLWRNANGVIAIWRMNGGAIQGASFLPGVGPEWSAIDGAADYNGDGRSDVLWRNSGGQVVAWFMNGTVSGSATLGAVGFSWQIIDARSDFDGDGRSDLLWQNTGGMIMLWTISGGTLTGAFVVGDVGAEWLVGAGSGATDGRTRGTAAPFDPSPAVRAISPVATLAPIGARPMNPADCPRLADPVAARAGLADLDADIAQVREILRASGAIHGEALLAANPGDFALWIRLQGRIDFGSIGGAVHETNHGLDFDLSVMCQQNGPRWSYFRDDRVHRTSLQRNQTANYSIAAAAVPDRLKRRFRYPDYIEDSARYNGNDFTALLGELNAYTGAAGVEVAMLQRLDPQRYAAFLPARGTVTDSNVGGLADFQLYLLAYLKAARLNHPETWAVIRAQPDTLSFIALLWSRAEEVLIDAFPFTVGARGPLSVPTDVLSTTYSTEFLDELDRLGIPHRSAADFATTYLR
jgi:hypothetical protein